MKQHGIVGEEHDCALGQSQCVLQALLVGTNDGVVDGAADAVCPLHGRALLRRQRTR
jgi:hypothetical protein